MWKEDLYICCAVQDARWAEDLASRIRKYKLPGNVALPDDSVGYARIHVDASESPFSEEITGTLDGCRYMLVMCSPRTKNSEPILARLRYFEETRGKTNIIAVIVEGEPIDSFPPFFIEQKMVPHILPDGSIEERLETIEPVASDLRGQSKKHTEQLFRYETVRIVASVMGLEPDALEQRHNRRQRQRRISIAAACCVILLGVSAVFAYFGIIAKHEGDIASKQTKASLAVAERLFTELPQNFAKDPFSAKYVEETVLDAVYALYQTGSTNLARVDADSVLALSDADGGDLLLRKASVIRATGREGAAAAYEKAWDALELPSSDRALFLERMAAMQGQALGMYILTETEHFQKGDVVLALDGQAVSGAEDWHAALDESVAETIQVIVLRAKGTAEETAAVSPKELKVAQVIGI